MGAVKQRTASYEDNLGRNLGSLKRMMEEFENRINLKVSDMKSRTERMEKKIEKKVDSDGYTEQRGQDELNFEKLRSDVSEVGAMLQKHDKEFVEVYRILNGSNKPEKIDYSRVNDLGNILDTL